MTRGVYQIRNVLTGDCYIGQSIDIEGRWAQHRSYGIGVGCCRMAAWQDAFISNRI